MTAFRLRPLLVLLGLFGALTAAAQGKYGVTKSHVRFFSAAPLENIEADNGALKGIVDFEAGTFTFRLPIKEFSFEKDLMRKHFNENYLESEKYPTATFKGKLQAPATLPATGDYQATATGELTIHGVAQTRTLPCTISIRDGAGTVSSKFKVKLVDHRVEIPTLVFNKIAEEVEVTVEATLEKLPPAAGSR